MRWRNSIRQMDKAQYTLHVKRTSVKKEIQLLARPAPFMSALSTLTFSGLKGNNSWITKRPGHYFKIMLGVIWCLKWLSARRTFATVLHSRGPILNGHLKKWPIAVIWQCAWKRLIWRLGRIAKTQATVAFPNEVFWSCCLALSLNMPGGPLGAGLGASLVPV